MRYLIVPIVMLLMCGCTRHCHYDQLQKSLERFINDKDANIGVAVIIDDKDTVTVNGDREYPMLSVYKFPIALAFAEYYRQNCLSLDDSVAIFPEDLIPDTYSPMTEKILAISEVSTDTFTMPAKELLSYMLQQSDNNASDIVLREIGGPKYVENYLRQIGVAGISVKNTENEMHIDNGLCYSNCATPIGIASLMNKFDREFDDAMSLEIKQMLETCETGANRLAKPLEEEIIGHKTGTGFNLPDDRLMAVNDVGYIHIDKDHHYTISVFIENSGYDMNRTESLIAELSRIVYDSVKQMQ